jgi:hypothetical protein
MQPELGLGVGPEIPGGAKGIIGAPSNSPGVFPYDPVRVAHDGFGQRRISVNLDTLPGILAGAVRPTVGVNPIKGVIASIYVGIPRLRIVIGRACVLWVRGHEAAEPGGIVAGTEVVEAGFGVAFFAGEFIVLGAGIDDGGTLATKGTEIGVVANDIVKQGERWVSVQFAESELNGN